MARRPRRGKVAIVVRDLAHSRHVQAIDSAAFGRCTFSAAETDSGCSQVSLFSATFPDNLRRQSGNGLRPGKQ